MNNSLNNQIYSYMTDKSQSQPVLNMLSLIRLHPQCKIIPTRVDFSTPNKSPSTQTSITPSFNNDRCFYTPSFSLSADIKYYRENLPFQKSQFEEKIQRSLQQTSYFSHPHSQEDLIVVAPHSNYCQICQEKFEDYFAHILLNSHRIRMTKSEASDKIKELCLEFQALEEGREVKGKTKNIRKEQKRNGKIVKGAKVQTSKIRSISTIQGSTNLQNNSTGIIEDTLV